MRLRALSKLGGLRNKITDWLAARQVDTFTAVTDTSSCWKFLLLSWESLTCCTNFFTDSWPGIKGTCVLLIHVRVQDILFPGIQSGVACGLVYSCVMLTPYVILSEQYKWKKKRVLYESHSAKVIGTIQYLAFLYHGASEIHVTETNSCYWVFPRGVVAGEK